MVCNENAFIIRLSSDWPHFWRGGLHSRGIDSAGEINEANLHGILISIAIQRFL